VVEAIIHAEYKRSYADDAAVFSSDEFDPDREDQRSSQTLEVRNSISIYFMYSLTIRQRSSQDKAHNIFDDLPALAAPKWDELKDELTAYLSTDPVNVRDGLAWWVERQAMYPHLSRMAINYLSIPGRL
jgi:hAT family C-terminal dimerisation region